METLTLCVDRSETEKNDASVWFEAFIRNQSNLENLELCIRGVPIVLMDDFLPKNVKLPLKKIELRSPISGTDFLNNCKETLEEIRSYTILNIHAMKILMNESPKLKKMFLGFDDNLSRSADSSQIDTLSPNTSLDSLEIWIESSNRFNDEVNSILKKCPNIKRLSLMFGNLDIEGWRFVAFNMKNLHFLQIKSCRDTRIGFENIKKFVFLRVKSLIMEVYGSEVEELEYIARSFPSLEKLKLYLKFQPDDILMELFEKCKNLKEIEFNSGGNSLSTSCLIFFLQNSPQLKLFKATKPVEEFSKQEQKFIDRLVENGLEITFYPYY